MRRLLSLFALLALLLSVSVVCFRRYAAGYRIRAISAIDP
jgi:hypothetical protein